MFVEVEAVQTCPILISMTNHTYSLDEFKQVAFKLVEFLRATYAMYLIRNR